MASHYHSQITRLEKEIASLEKDTATSAKKEADLLGKINRVQVSINRATSVSSAQSRFRELEQARRALANIKKQQSDIAARKVQKVNSLLDYQKRQARADEIERKKIESEQRKLQREHDEHLRRIAIETRRRSWATHAESAQTSKFYDFFICHASEDKDDFVRKLAENLKAKGAEVWYDEFELKVGSKLRREIDRGLVSSKFGIVVVSEHFFKKEWPQKELDGLFSLDTLAQSRILPIWHKVTKDEVVKHSPIIADIVALNTGNQGIEEIAEQLLRMIQ